MRPNFVPSSQRAHGIAPGMVLRDRRPEGPCPKGAGGFSPGLNGAKIRVVRDDSRLGKAVGKPTQAGSQWYINFPECETMSQKHLPGGPRNNGNHADRLM